MRVPRRLADLRGPSGPPPAVVVLLVIEVIVVAILLASGVQVADLLKSAGPVVALTLALLNPTVQELGRRRPRLTVEASEVDRHGVVVAPALRPWPIDVERIVSNELADAHQTVEALSAISDTFAAFSDPLAARPSAADHERAKQAFQDELVAYEAELRIWLEHYQEASRERADSFTLTLRLDNAGSGAHADSITVVLDLPDVARLVDELPEIEPPPDRPTYEPPRPRLRSSLAGFDHYGALVQSPSAIFPRSIAPPVKPETWTLHDDDRRLEAAIGDVQAGRSLRLGDPLLIRVAGSGRHELTWLVYSKSLRRPATGTLILDVPVDSDRPAFGRLHGILTFPDVPIVDEHLEDEDRDEEDACGDQRVARREVRTTDPPGPPASTVTDDDRDDEDEDGRSLIRRLDEASKWWESRALGLDPAHDGPDRSEVRRVERADSGQPPEG